MIKDILINLDWVPLFQDRPPPPFEDALGLQNRPLALRLDTGVSLDLGGGLSRGERAYTFAKVLSLKIPSYIDFDTLPIPFRAGVMEVPNGKVELLGQGDLAEAIRASISLPLVFEPMVIDGKRYIDGGTGNNLPVREAAEMGYDIIIAVDLFSGTGFDPAPLNVPLQILDRYFSALSGPQYPLATAVLHPDVADFSIFDFKKAKEIYAGAFQNREQLREQLAAIREKISPFEKREIPSYSELSSIVPRHLVVSGALPVDRKPIEKAFTRMLEGKPLEGDNLSAFIDGIYRTGHYRFVTTRSLADEAVLELILDPEESSKTLLLAGLGYQGTLSANSISALSAGINLQFRGLTGPGSALFLDISGGTPLNALAVDLMFLHPLAARVFVSAGGVFTLSHPASPPAICDVRGTVNLGLRFNRYTALDFGPGLAFAGETRKTALDFTAGLGFNSLDYQHFATRGVYAKLENTFLLPLPADAGFMDDLVSLDVSVPIPLTPYLSLIPNIFVSSGFNPNAGPERTALCTAGVIDRTYFPHLAGRALTGANKAAALLILQYQPWKNLTLMGGGQLLFSISAAAGKIDGDWRGFPSNALLWNASGNIGLRIGESFALRFQAGAGGSAGGRIAPFLSIDIGSFRY